MSSLASKLIGEAYEPPKRETRTYTVTARPDHLDQIETFFSWINSTRSGHSGSAKLYVDGDGAARVEIEKKGGELQHPEEGDIHDSGGGKPEFEVGLESVSINKSTPLPVIQDTKPMTILRCPHCREEIYEKHSYRENGKDFHSDCGGAIEFPGPSPEEKAYFEKHWKISL